MKNDIATFYVVLVLPAISGLILFVEGFFKLLSGKKIGLVSLVFAVLFLITAIIAYFFLSNFYRI